MNLLEAISYSELRIKAGGVGSGPNAPCPQCGPKSGKDKNTESGEKFKGPKGGKTPKPLGDVGFQPISGKKPSGASKLYEKYKETQQKGTESMQHFKEHAPQTKGKPINEGDIVKTTKPMTVWNQKTGNNDTYPPGKKVTVINILPKVGQADQMISVQVSKHHDPDYMKMNDVVLHKSVGGTITPEPVPTSKIKVQYTSNDGAQVTVVKSPKEPGEYEPKTLKEMASKPSPYKGTFEKLDKVTPVPKEIEEEYMPEKYEKHTTYIFDSETKESGTGVTVYVHRYPDRVTVQEQHYTRFSHIDKPLITWKYDNVEKARLMLQKRYSIKIGHKELKKL